MGNNKGGSKFGVSHRCAVLKKSGGRNATRRTGHSGPRAVAYVLAAFLLVFAGLLSFAGIKSVYAQAGCVLLCPPTPTPTPRPTPSPTPQPMPSPTPRPTPTSTLTPTATAAAKPKPSPTAALPTPTAIPTEVAPTPERNAVSVPPVTRKSGGSQAGQNGILRFVALGAVVFFVLLLGLELGWVIVRRALLPPLGGKLPPSGARPWSRFRVPNPNSLIPWTRTESAPASASAFWSYDSPAGNIPETAVNGSTSGYWPVQPVTTPDDAYRVSSTIGVDLTEVDTSRILPAHEEVNPGANSSDRTLAFSRGGSSGWQEKPRKKRRGLIARASFYTGLASTDENE